MTMIVAQNTLSLRAGGHFEYQAMGYSTWGTQQGNVAVD